MPELDGRKFCFQLLTRKYLCVCVCVCVRACVCACVRACVHGVYVCTERKSCYYCLWLNYLYSPYTDTGMYTLDAETESELKE